MVGDRLGGVLGLVAGGFGVPIAPGLQAGILALALAAASGPAAAQLAGNEWRPMEISNIDVPAGAGLFVRFGGEGKLEGDGGCNRFFGAYTRTRCS